ncbi:MAG: response regulator [Actinobacteria bacterium]|nr:response regulator [Actinomycetota bacterium]
MRAPPPGSRRFPSTDVEWFTLGQAAGYLGVAQSTIRKWTDAGRVPAFKTPGGHRRYRRSDLDGFLAQSGPRPELRGPVILIVDDDDGLRAVVRSSLELAGYAVLEAASAEEGLTMLEQRAPDLILLDVVMPDVDGWEMLKRVQERHGVGSIPVLMFSGQVDERALEQATARGANAFLPKGVDPQELVESARQILPI